MKSRLLLLAKAIVAVCAIYWLIAEDRLDLKKLAKVDDLSWLVAGFLGIFVSVLIPGVRWWLLLRSQGYQISAVRAMWLTWFGCAAGIFLPGAIAGDAARMIAVMKTVPGSRASLVVIGLLDRVLGMIGLAGTSLFSLLFLTHSIANRNFLLLILSLMLVGFMLGGMALSTAQILSRLLSFVPVRWRVEGLVSTSTGVGTYVLFLGVVLSFISNISCALALGYCGAAVGFPLGTIESLTYGPMAFLSNCLPISPGGLGIGEATSDHLFASSGMAGGAEAMIIFRVLLAIVVLPGLLALFSGSHQSRKDVVQTAS